MSGDGSGSTPPTPSTSTGIPPISPFLTPTPGIRYPFYAAVQGTGPLLYSPAIFSQAMFPWRALASSGTTVPASASTQSYQTSASTSSSSTQLAALPTATPTATPFVQSLTALAQLPGLVYPLPAMGMPMLAPQQGAGGSPQSNTSDGRRAGGGEAIKRKTESTSSAVEAETKRPRLVEGIPHSPSFHPPASPSPKVVSMATSPAPQRSPVIKFVPYNPGQLGQSVMIPSAMSQATSTSMSALPQAIVLPTIPSSNVQQHSHSSSHHQQHQQQPSQGTGETSQGTQRSPYKLPTVPHPPLDVRILLLKCFGPVAESVVNQNRLIVSNLLQDLYRPSYFTTSNYSDPPLSPESCALLTICYLNSLRPGELMNTENLRTMMHYAQLGELEWLHYYKKHKKMSESTFVQSQLMHLSRIAVYPVLGKIRVMISNQNLGEGVSVTLQNLAQLASVSKQSLPEFVVVLAVRPSATIDFCVLVLNPLQVKVLQEMQGRTLANGGAKKNGKSDAQLQDTCKSSGSFHLRIDKNLVGLIRSFQRKLNGNVLIPFHHPNPIPESVSMTPNHLPPHSQFFRHSKVPSSVAESLLPTASHIIEHKPRGPFQDQYSIAMYMLQKLMSGWGSQAKISEFQKVEFRVLCPPEESFVSQTIAEILESGLFDHLELTTAKGSSLHAEIQQRVIRCCSQDDSAKFSSFLEEVAANPKVLYLTIAESAHLTSSINHVVRPAAPGLPTPSSDNVKLLCSLSNCLLISVSSHPYVLQTNRSLVSYANEVHWPLRSHVQSPEGSANAVAAGNTLFCCAHDYQAGLWDYGVTFREDSAFEGMFLEAAGNLGPAPLDLPTLRVQLLLNQYIAALLSGSAHAGSPSALPETQEIVNCLIDGPLSNARGYGSMVIVRSHDVDVARQFYHKLKAVRDSLGLKYRFEMILEDGSKRLTLSEHFAKRVSKWRGSNYHGNQPPGHVMSYRELENLPCLVVLAGQSRAGLGFPSSLRYVDLRLCYSPLLSRAVYEHDISLLNAYRTLRPKTTPTGLLGCTTGQEKEEPMEDGGEESDCEVFEDSPTGAGSDGKPHPLPVRTSSSSSSRKSSYSEEQPEEKEEQNHGRTNIVEWRPEPRLKRKSQKNMGNENGTVTQNQIQDDEVHSPNGEPVTVTIDPPDDQVLEYHSQDGESQSQDSNIPSRQSNSSDDDLTADLDGSESESEEEECGSATHTCVCLLSRPYYHIWSSRSPHQHLLLPPSPGVDWHGGHKRPPLFDSDPHQQSAYYRKWSKPSEREVKNVLDPVIKEASKGSRRRFLLTGPPQVGKTGAWLLLIRLIYDHIRAAQGVVVVNTPTPPSMFLESNPRDGRPCTNRPPRDISSTSSGDGSLRQSRVISLEHLQRISQEIQEDEKPALITIQDGSPKTNAQPSPRQGTTSNSVRHTISLPVSPYIAYDYTHSCTDCSRYLRGSPVAHAEILTSLLPTGNGGHVTIQWHVPTYQQKHCVISPDRKTLERLKLALRPKSDKSIAHLIPFTPIFTPTMGRDTSGLFNLFHTSYNYLHVLVTTAGQFERYCKTWPNHLIMTFQEQGSLGLGQTYSLLKQFALYNYQLNKAMLQFEGNSRDDVWPYMVIMSDNCVMWKRLTGEGARSSDVSLSEVMCSLEQSVKQLQCSAVGLLQWNKQLEEGTPPGLSDYELNHDFIMLNLPRTAGIHYNCFSYNSAMTDFNLQLKASGLKAELNTEFAFVKKHLISGGNFYPLHYQLSGLCWDVDMLVISLHHDSSSLLPHPGPYLMEHFLLHRSRVLFPYACQEHHPILMVDNYVNLGPSIHIMFVKSNKLQNWEVANSDEEEFSRIHFGGLMLYLCEGKTMSEQLHKLNFVPGASLCLVTRDCKSLVREVARLDLEEKWKFRLRDEYQTACPDDLRPLFFLTGRFET